MILDKPRVHERKRDEHELDIPDRICERFGRIRNQEQRAGSKLNPEAEPDDVVQALHWGQRQVFRDTEDTQVDDDARANQQSHADRVE